MKNSFSHSLYLNKKHENSLINLKKINEIVLTMTTKYVGKYFNSNETKNNE